jgi:hypothetical protein
VNAQIGRVQWSKLGITIYDAVGSFVTRIEHERDRHLFNEVLVAALKKISEEQMRRTADPAEARSAAG